MKTDFKTLKELHEYYAVHNSCELKKVATQPVYETSIPSSGILFIGEAPGRNEDLQGRPFVGAAGKFLDELLKSIRTVSLLCVNFELPEVSASDLNAVGEISPAAETVFVLTTPSFNAAYHCFIKLASLPAPCKAPAFQLSITYF